MTQPESMVGRVCLITGSTSGIGEATAHALAKMGATIIIHGRDQDRCRRTVDAIGQASGNQAVSCVVGDLASLEGVRTLAAEINSRIDLLHILINNAGAMYPDYRETVDGIEATLAVNHLAPFLLTKLLLDRLKAGAPARIVNLASGSHRRAVLDFDDLHSRKEYEARAVYARSKLMNILFTAELARRLEGSGVTVNAVSPGIVHTEFGLKDGMGEQQRAIMAGGMPPEQGARTSVYLASAPEVANVTGGYFQDCAQIEASEGARSGTTARRLWEISEQLIGLR